MQTGLVQEKDSLQNIFFFDKGNFEKKTWRKETYILVYKKGELNVIVLY